MRALLIACYAASMLGCSDQDKPANNAVAATPSPDIDVPVFNADSAFVLLKRQVEFGPRVPGSKGHAAQLAWMQEYLRARTDSVTVQSFTHKGSDGESVGMSNVIARFNPGASKRVLLLAHWDTRPEADQDPVEANRSKPIPGANDGASGVAVLLALADMFKATPPPIGVDILFTDGEDWQPDMYVGAKYFSANLPAGYRPMYGILIDMVGDQNPVFPIEDSSNRYAPEVVERVWRTAEKLGLSAMFPRRNGGAVGDDHDALNAAGIRTINIFDGEYGAPVPSGTFGLYWHTLQDTVEHTSPVGLGGVGRVLAYLVYSGG